MRHYIVRGRNQTALPHYLGGPNPPGVEVMMTSTFRATTVGRAGDTADPPRADIDPVLEQQLASAADDTLVEAVLLFRDAGPNLKRDANPQLLLKRASGNAWGAAMRFTYLPRIGALIVRASPAIIRRLIAQPEIAVACANRDDDEQPNTRTAQ
jgi:hypothetical protein